MLSAGPFFVISASLFLVYALFTSWEEKNSRRVILAKVRESADSLVIRLYTYLRQKIRYLVRHTIKLSWYYSIHSMLKTMLTLLVKAYDRLEDVLIKNRERARLLRAEQRTLSQTSHLTAMAEHKISTALTPSQKKKLRARKLERE